MTRELIWLHLNSNNHRKTTCHLPSAREVWSYAFSVNQAAGCSAVSLILIQLLSLCQYSSLAVWSAFPLIPVSFKEEMINMWLQVGSGDAQRWLGVTLHGLSLASARLKYLLNIPVHGFLTNGKLRSETHSFWSRHFKLQTIALRSPLYLP